MLSGDDGLELPFKGRIGPRETIICLMWLLVFSTYYIALGLLIFHPVYHETGQHLFILWIILLNGMMLIHASSGGGNLIETFHTPLTKTIIFIIMNLSMALAGFFLLMLSADLGFTFGNIVILWLTISGIAGACLYRFAYQEFLNC